jgi:formate/nitrite transporter FocA (FNT family)
MGLPGLIKLIGALIFPVGLMLVTVTGAELYTGNTAVVSMAALDGRASFGGLMHNW